MTDPRTCRVCPNALTKPRRGPWPTYCGVQCRRRVEFARRRVARMAETIKIWRPLMSAAQLNEMRAELDELARLAEGNKTENWQQDSDLRVELFSLP